jgi:hypothetical protein
LNDSGAENVFGGPVHDVKQAVLPGRNAENMRRTGMRLSTRPMS